MNGIPSTYAGYRVIPVTLRQVGVEHYWKLEHLHPCKASTRAEFDAWRAGLPAGLAPVADYVTNYLMGEHAHAFADSWEVVQMLRERTRYVPHWVRIFATPSDNLYESGTEPQVQFLNSEDRAATTCDAALIDWEACAQHPHPKVLWLKPLWPLTLHCWGPFRPAARFLGEHVIVYDYGTWETVYVGDTAYFLEDSLHPKTRRGVPVTEMESRLKRFPLFAQELKTHHPEKWRNLQAAIEQAQAVAC